MEAARRPWQQRPSSSGQRGTSRDLDGRALCTVPCLKLLSSNSTFYRHSGDRNRRLASPVFCLTRKGIAVPAVGDGLPVYRLSAQALICRVDTNTNTAEHSLGWPRDKIQSAAWQRRGVWRVTC